MNDDFSSVTSAGFDFRFGVKSLRNGFCHF